MGSRNQLPEQYTERYIGYWNATNYHTCGLCHQIVKDNKQNIRGYYGMLKGCIHAFCLSCIREYVQIKLVLERQFWNAENLCGHRILCPICHVPSLYIMANHLLITDAAEKERFVYAFLENNRDVRCEFYRCGIGACFCINPYSHDRA